jgi:hypothetical protein
MVFLNHCLIVNVCNVGMVHAYKCFSKQFGDVEKLNDNGMLKF